MIVCARKMNSLFRQLWTFLPQKYCYVLISDEKHVLIQNINVEINAFLNYLMPLPTT